MSETNNANDEYRPRCINLMCKSMLVYGEAFESDPQYEAGLTDFWCQCTGKGLGPDGDGVALEECRNKERSCFREF
jgi:hypothetical protein